MHSTWFRSTFLRVFRFVQSKEGGPNFWGKPIQKKVWIICSPLLYFNFKSFLVPNSLSFIRFQCSLHDSGVLYSQLSNFYKLKRRGCKFWGERILRKSELFAPHLLYFNFQSSMDPNFLSFIIRFECILHDAWVLLSVFGNFYKL